ncbi:MAG: VWA domain-containing protein [Clostridia bacterium]|nr:VWA domain-containing protein [Clostridia bacterium]
MQKFSKRSVSFFLTLLFVLSAFAPAAGTFTLQAAAQTPAAGEAVTVVACSDYQYPNTDEYGVGATGNAGGAILATRISAQLQSAGISGVDGFFCAGDFDYDLNRRESDTAAGITSLENAVTSSGLADSSTEFVNVQGNHDPKSTAGGTSPSGDNDPSSGAYGVFVINERDYQWASTGINEAATLELCESMRRYFNSKIAVNYTAPIFVISHLPLHYSMRTKNDGDNIYAKDIFDVLQDAADNGLNIIFMFGHNHSQGWDDYLGGANIFLTPGSSINIAELGSRDSYTAETLKFTYMNAGYTGYYEHRNTATGTASSTTYDLADLTMTSFEISASDVVIKRFNASGETALKKAGVYNYYKNENTSVSYQPDATVVDQPYTLSLTDVPETEYEIDPVVAAQVIPVGTGEDKTYKRITDVSQLVDGGTYVMVATGTKNGQAADFMGIVAPKAAAAQGSKTGLNIVKALPDGFSLGSTLSGKYSSYEWTFHKDGDKWILESANGSLTMTDQGGGSYNVIVSENGTPVSITESVNNRPDEFEVHGWNDIYLDRYDGTDSVITAWAAAGNSVTVAFYGTKSESGVVTKPYTDHSAISAVYPRITDASQLVDGERYVLIYMGLQNTSSTYTANSTNYLLSHELKTQSVTGFNPFDSAFTGSISDTLTGRYGEYEFLFTKSGSQWKLSDDSGQVTMALHSGSSSAFDVSYSSSGTPYNIIASSQSGGFLLTTTIGGTELVFDHDKTNNVVNGYRKSNSGNQVVFAIYGAKKLSDTTIQRYVKQNVTSTSDLTAGETYLVVNGDKALDTADNMRAMKVEPLTDENGNKYIDYGNHGDYEMTWTKNSSSNTYDFVNKSNQKLQIGRSGGIYSETTTYNRVTSLENGSVYIIATAAGKALSSAASGSNRAAQNVTISGNAVTSTTNNNYTSIEWTYVLSGSNKRLKASNDQYLSISRSTASLSNSAVNLTIPNFSNNTTTIKANGYLRYSSSDYFYGARNSDNATSVSFYKKNTTSTFDDSSCTYALSTGTDAAQYLTLENVSNGTAKILLHSNQVGDYTTYSRYVGAPVTGASYQYFTESDTGADFEFYKLEDVTVAGDIDPVTEAEDENNSPIESVTISGKEATLYIGASASTYTGLYFNIVYKSEAKAANEAQIPIKVGDLIDYSGHNNVASYCNEAGDITGLGAYYSAMDGAWFSDLILHIIQKEDYPEYPNEGSVRVGKTSGSPNFLTNGVTQVELTATGVPMSPGIDIVLMLDTSSSMTNTIGGITRLDALQTSVGAMLDYLSEPNETTGQIPDITMAIADFNGYWDTEQVGGTTDTYLSRNDHPNGTTSRTTTNSAQHCTILTGPNAGSETYDNSAFIPVSELSDSSSANYFDSSTIACKSGTNYDQALQTVYKLFEARQAYNASQQDERETVVIFMSDGGPFQYNFFTSQSTTYLWNYWLLGTYDEDLASDGSPVSGEPAATTTYNSSNDTIYRDYLSNHNDMTELLADYNGGEHWYFYNGKGNSNRYAEALKGDKDKLYTVVTKDPDAYCNDRNSDGFCDLCGKCTVECVDHDHDGLCDVCGHIDQCSHTDANSDGFCDVCGCCMDGCQTYQYLTQVSGLGATVYSIMFCKETDKAISMDAMDYIIKDIATDESKAYPDAQSAEDLTNAFMEIASNFVQAGTNAYFVDTMGAAYDIQLATVFTKNNGEYEQTYTLDPRPTIEVKKHKVYTRADYANGVISSYDQIGTRTGASETVEVVSFNDDGTEAYSSLIGGGTTNIYTDGLIRAKSFIYNNTSSPVMIDTDGDGVNDYSLDAETFYWTIGIIEDTEYALTYWLYLTGSMEGTREPGSFQTNQAAILYYDNYLGHECWQEVFSPVQAWKAANITFEFYLVDDMGNPVNSAGEVVPFANRVLIGNKQTETFNLNSNDTQTASDLFEVAAADLPDYYELYSPDSRFAVALYSGDDYNTSRAIITDDVTKYGSSTDVTTYYYDQYNTYNRAGDVPSNLVYDYANTHVAFGVKRVVTIVPDAVVIDYGLPVKVHPLLNDIALFAGTKINNVGTALAEGAETNVGYPESKLTNAAKELTLEHGTASVVNGDTSADTYVVYSPSDMLMDREVVLYYEVYMNSHYYYSTVTVIPAANIYYEDSFLEFIDGTGANASYVWQTAGETYEGVYQAEDRPGTFALATYDANNVYGNDAAYDDSVATYSLGSARYVTLDTGAKATPAISPRAEFDFCGTGFDVISVTSGQTGLITVTVTNTETGESQKRLVNTYYGYGYGRLYLNAEGSVTLAETDEAGNENLPLYYFAESFNPLHPTPDADELIVRVNGRVFTTKNHSDSDIVYDYAYGWLSETTSDGVLYQIPVLKFDGLDYGTYHVTIQPRYAAMYDIQGAGRYDVYVDGIRVYDPAGTGDNVSTVVAEAYEQDKERNPVIAKVRDTVIGDTEGFLRQTSGVGETDVGGTIMVDGMFVTASSATALRDLTQSGPNNEMYLAQYQALAFKPAVVASRAPASFQLGMKVAITGVDGETEQYKPSVASVRVIISDVKRMMIRHISTITVSGSAEQFYDLSPLLSWTKSEDETTYVADYDVVILNDSDAVLSLTTFKTTFSSLEEEAEEPVLALASNKRTLSFATMAVNKVLTSADTSTLDIKWDSTDLEAGATATLSVTTSDEIVSVTVGDTEITDYTDNGDGTRTWTYSFTVVENGEGSYDVILKDAFGRVSETYTADVPLKEEPTTGPAGDGTGTDETQTQDSGSEDRSFAARLRAVLDWLLDLFRRIINFFKSL